MRIEKTTYHVEGALIGQNSLIQMSITDYEIFRLEKPQYIMLRVINNDELEELSIAEVSYTPVMESRLVGVDKLIAMLNKKKSDCY